MEKNGSLVLSPQELEEIKAGTVPSRIASTWGLTLEELSRIIETNQYRLLGESSSFVNNS